MLPYLGVTYCPIAMEQKARIGWAIEENFATVYLQCHKAIRVPNFHSTTKGRMTNHMIYI